MKLNDLKAYEVLSERKIEDLNSLGTLLRHKKTGARIALLENDDENKVFYVGFRTPPKNSTGVAHILEHSVLVGSKEFPVKDPFIELAKGSLNTFLNAMTYPDKTIYPIASCNDQDFQNLMHVYLDAVFFPNIYKNKNIFLQEGWHYELDESTGELGINGVVYNEMKGAFSSPDDVLEREIMNRLYPNTPYGVESGGDPEDIPNLSYEEFLDFHRTFYHPSNSYIYLYGNMNMEEKLDFIDRNYLSAFDAIEVDSNISLQPEFEEMSYVTKEYPIGEEESEKENAYFALNFTVGDSLDKELYIAFQILDYALCSAPGAPIKEALIKKKIGKDVYSNSEFGIRQPYFSIIAKNAEAEQKREFLSTIQEILLEQLKYGISRKALKAGLNYYEFRYREADFGSYPKGLMYGIQMLDSWLYNDNLPFIHIEANETYKNLKDKIETGYFEDLISQYLLANTHRTMVMLVPKKGLTQQRDQAKKIELQKYKDSLSKEQLNRITEEMKALEAWQEEEDSPENLAKIPVLNIEDIKKEASILLNEEREMNGIKVLFHPVFTNGIGYLRLVFNIKNISESDLPYIGLFKGVLGLLNTENYSYGELFNEMNIVTGGIAAVNNVYARIDDLNKYTMTLEIKTKVLYENLQDAFTLLKEMMFTSDFCDEKRLAEIIAQSKSRLQGQMMSAGHSIAVNRAFSYFSKTALLNEKLSGMDFYRNIEEWDHNFEQYEDCLCEKLQKLSKMIFDVDNLMVDYVAEESGYKMLAPCVEDLQKHLYNEILEEEEVNLVPVRKNEGYKSSSQVQYVARAGNFYRKGLEYNGSLKVLKIMMGYDYLWNQVRVKGGAYGCMCSFGKLGDCYFVSYRDPNLKGTVKVYEEAADYISKFEASERTMTQYIIGAISELDTPMNPAAKGLFSLSCYMTGMTNEILQKERDELLNTDIGALRDTSKYIKAFMEDDCICVVGNSEKIEQDKDLFDKTESLFIK